MKLALAFVFVAISIAVASAGLGLTCITDEKKCSEDECCIKVTNLIGRCKKLKQEDEKCEMNPRKMLIKKHVYLRTCPCATGMKCHAKDGLIGKILGTCQQDSSEIVETEAPKPKTEAPEPETEAPEPETEAPEPETEAPEPETEAPDEEIVEPEPEEPEAE